MIRRSDTKELLVASLLDLSKTKSLEKITISDITQNCSLRRETFYKHFPDKYALIGWVYESMYLEVCEKYLGRETYSHTAMRCLAFLKENESFTKEAFKYKGPNSFRESLLDCTLKALENLAAEKMQGKTLTLDLQYYIHMFAHGSVGITEEWVKGNFKEPVEYIAEKMVAALPDTLKALYQS